MTELNKETRENIAQLQAMEQRLQSLMMQKQQFQGQLLEVENALKETKELKGDAFKIIGPIMISSKIEDIKKDLKEKKEMFDLRLKNIDKQEKKIKDEASELQEKVMKELGQ